MSMASLVNQSLEAFSVLSNLAASSSIVTHPHSEVSDCTEAVHLVSSQRSIGPFEARSFPSLGALCLSQVKVAVADQHLAPHQALPPLPQKQNGSQFEDWHAFLFCRTSLLNSSLGSSSSWACSDTICSVESLRYTPSSTLSRFLSTWSSHSFNGFLEIVRFNGSGKCFTNAWADAIRDGGEKQPQSEPKTMMLSC